MNEEIQKMPFDQLRTLHREVGALIAQRRHEALEELKVEAALLNFWQRTLLPRKEEVQAEVSQP